MQLFDTKDSGFLSRKFILTLICMILVMVSGVVAAYLTALGPLYTTLIGGLLGALGLYLTGNVAQTFSAGSANAKIIEASGAVSEEPEESN